MFVDTIEPKLDDFELLTTLTGNSGDIYVLVSSDHMRLLLAVCAGVENNKPALSSIKNLLSEKNVTCSINENAIQDLLDSLSESQPCTDYVVIGRGKEPVNGQDSHLLPLFDPDNQKVNEGDALFKQVAAAKGKKGKDIFGELVEAKDGKELKLTIGTNVVMDEEKDCYVAEVDGFAVLSATGTNNHVAVSEDFVVSIEEGGMRASVSFDDTERTGEDLIKFIKSIGINTGLQEDSIKKAVGSEGSNKLLIAEGVPVEEGEEADIKYYFSRKKCWKTIKSTNCQLQGKNVLQMYEPDQVLLKLKLPVQGTDGVNIFGVKLPAKTIKETTIIAGDNVNSEQKQNVIAFYPKMRGAPILTNHKLEVIDEFIVNGDLHPDVGDIDFEGNIIVNGDIQNGPGLRSDKNISVKGVVYKSSLKADGDIEVMSGLSSIEPGQIHCKGNFSTRYLDECHIEVDGDLIVENEIIASHIYCRGALICENGEIHGGNISVLRGVNVGSLGSESQVITHLAVGIDYIYERHLREASPEIKSLNQEELRINQELYEFKIKPEILKLATPQQKQDFKSKLLRLTAIVKKKKEINEPLEIMKEAVDKVANKEIQVNQLIYPGTRIKLGEASYECRLAIKGPVRLVEGRKNQVKFIEN